MSIAPLRLGRYELHGLIASGGMARVHVGLVHGAQGFSRPVAIKRLHPEYARDREFVAMLSDEARTTSAVRHPNVVPVLDVEEVDGEPFLVMECVHGVALSELLRQSVHATRAVPVDIASAIMADMLAGLHAAHCAIGPNGPLCIVHRDVSPQNVLVGADGIARVLDFGIAKAVSRAQSTTRDGAMKGKPAYMAPEQILGAPVDARADVYAAGVVLWEMLAGRRLFERDSMSSVVAAILAGAVEPLSVQRPDLPPALCDAVHRALAREPGQRFVDAAELARAVEAASRRADRGAVERWVRELASDSLARLSALLEEATTSRSAGVGAPVAVLAPTAQLVATPAGLVARRRRRPVALGAIAVGGVAVVAFGGWFASRGLPPAEARVEVGAPTLEPMPPAPVLVADPQPVAAPAQSPLPNPAAHKRVKARVPAAADCDPPFTVDADGVKVFKRGCIR